MKSKLTLINWEDAITPTSSWTDIKDLKHELADCISIGLVVHEDEKTITIVSHISGDEESTDIVGSLVLDKTWIKYRKDLPLPQSAIKKVRQWVEKIEVK